MAYLSNEDLQRLIKAAEQVAQALMSIAISQAKIANPSVGSMGFPPFGAGSQYHVDPGNNQTYTPGPK